MKNIIVLTCLALSFQASAITRTVHCSVKNSSEKLMISLRGGVALVFINEEHTQTLTLEQQDSQSETLHYAVELGTEPVQETLDISFSSNTVTVTIDGNSEKYSCY
jgi:hypothetical protein